MIREQILELARQSPDYAKSVDLIEERLQQTAFVAEDLAEAIEMLEAALQNPEMYPQMVQAAIADGLIDVGDAPEEFDQVFIISMLIALYGLQDRASAQGFARGGLTVAGRHLANQGQGGDSMLAHVNPREAEVLRRMGGQGTVNPNTGLVEYKSLKKIFKVIAPIAIGFLVPGLGAAIGSAMGATAGSFTSTLAMGAAGALGGATSAALTGGDIGKGALMGGVTAGLGSAMSTDAAAAANAGGNTAKGVEGISTLEAVNPDLALQTSIDDFNPSIGTSLSPSGNTLGSSGQARGLFAPSKPMFNSMSPSDSVVDGLGQAATGMADPVLGSNLDLSLVTDPVINPMGFTPEPTSTGLPPEMGDLGGLRTTDLPSEMGYFAGKPTTGLPPQDPINIFTGSQPQPQPQPESSLFDSAIDYASNNKGAIGVGLLSGAASLMEADEEVGQAISSMSDSQREYFNRDLTQWDWNRVKSDASRANQSLSEFMARNFNDLTSGKYNTTALNRGGPLSKASRYVRGGGTGRSDEIPAYLSDGEYVIDAETVSMLGDGSSKAGANVLDAMRKQIRAHKGKNLAKGKFSADAKSPLAYLKQGAA